MPNAQRMLAIALLPLAISAFATQSRAEATLPAPDSVQASGFGYPTVNAALSALRTKAGVNITDEENWTIVDDKLDYTLWSFTPSTHAAYPAAIKQVLTKDANGNIRVVMTARCEAAKIPCDKLVEEFRGRSQQMAERARARLRSAQ